MKHLLLVYITARDREQARKIAKTLVCEKLAACANIIPAINSIYFWEGSLCDDTETALIVKTRSNLMDKLVKRAKTLHSYTVPCIVALPIAGGNPAFLDWITKETKKTHLKKPRPNGRKKQAAGAGLTGR
jgi:periplasmic divalent cation tolerance protein